MSRWLIVCLLGLFLFGNVQAQSVDPRELVMQTSSEMLDILERDKAFFKENPKALYDKVNDVVLPHFDFERMSRYVLGKHWRRASDEQKAAFAGEFQILLVRTYATALLGYAGQEIRYLPLHVGQGDTDVTVRTEIIPSGGFPIPVNYAMHKRDADWEVYDVAIDGVSLVTNYRTSMAQQIRRKGIDGLLKTLAERNRQATK